MKGSIHGGPNLAMRLATPVEVSFVNDHDRLNACCCPSRASFPLPLAERPCASCRDIFDLDPESFRHLPPQLGKMSGLEHQYTIPEESVFTMAAPRLPSPKRIHQHRRVV